MNASTRIGLHAAAVPLDQDPLIPLGDLADDLPRRRGRKVHKSTCFRWAQKGVHGEVLRTVAVGGQRCTRISWVLEWSERVAAAARRDSDTIKPRRRPIRRRSQANFEATPGETSQETCSS